MCAGSWLAHDVLLPSISPLTRPCSLNLELLTIKCCAFYVPWEFSSTIVSTVYILPESNKTLCYVSYRWLSQHMTIHRDAVLFVVADFNCANPRHAPPTFSTLPAAPWVKEYWITVTLRSDSSSWHLGNWTMAFVISEHAFRRVNTRKAAGQDGILNKVLRTCADQPVPVFKKTANFFLAQAGIPTCFKQSIIVPALKKQQSASLHDYHPVALTLVGMKGFKSLVRDFINSLLPATYLPV